MLLNTQYSTPHPAPTQYLPLNAADESYHEDQEESGCREDDDKGGDCDVGGVDWISHRLGDLQVALRVETGKLVGDKAGVPASIRLADLSQLKLLAIALQQGQAVLQQPDVDLVLSVSVGTIHLNSNI